jgi:hypothetical protein
VWVNPADKGSPPEEAMGRLVSMFKVVEHCEYVRAPGRERDLADRSLSECGAGKTDCTIPLRLKVLMTKFGRVKKKSEYPISTVFRTGQEMR